jgi:hypothetical protein
MMPVATKNKVPATTPTIVAVLCVIGGFMDVVDVVRATRGFVGEHLTTGSIRATEPNINEVQVSGSWIRS